MVDVSIASENTNDRAPLREGEVKYLLVALVAFIAIVVLSVLRNQAINWMSFFPGYAYSLGLLAIGVYIRVFKAAERIAALTVALSGYALFGISMGIVFHIYMPRPEPILDDLLLSVDHFFGYHWPDTVEWLAGNHAWFGRLLSYVYLSSFAQLIFVIVVLAASGRSDKLNLLLLTGMIGLFFTFVVWQLFPNFSMGIHYPIPADAEQAIRLVTNTAYGERLKDAALNGIPLISNQTMLGVVAFPSYHTVMTCLTVWFLFRTFAFWPAVIVNALMVPAIHIHGAHHILDFVGGIIVFYAALWTSKVILTGIPKINQVGIRP